MVKNPYLKATNKELKAIYEDILLSNKEGCRAESLVSYASEIKENIGGNFTLREALELANRDFFDEVSKRFFESVN